MRLEAGSGKRALSAGADDSSARNRERIPWRERMEEYSGRQDASNVLRDKHAMDRSDHLLKVAASINRDALDAWTQLWGEFKPHVTSSGAVLPSMEKGFVPSCGWPEFIERLWLLKHYLDSVSRVCQESP